MSGREITCPHCGGKLPTSAKKGIKLKRRTHYINAFGKQVYRTKLINSIMDARERGEIAPVPDWFPGYIGRLLQYPYSTIDKKQVRRDAQTQASVESWASRVLKA